MEAYMQRKRGELVPIGDAFSGMGGPVKAIREATPQARHHFTLADQVNQLVSGPVKRTPIWVSWRGSPLLTFLPSLAAVLLLAAGSLLQAQGSTTYYFPHLAVGASWQTTITYINYSPDEVTCRTEFISDQGSPLMVSFAELGMVDSRTDVLPPGGSVHQETDVALSAPLAPGWARATCSGPVQASLLFRWYSSEGMPVAEAGVNAATVPATRFVTFAEQGEGKNGTGVAYANPSDTAALVTFTARDADDGEVLAIEDLMLPPNWHGAHNMAPLFDLSSFTGSLEVTSTVPIVSLSLNFEAAPVFSSLPPGEVTPETPSEPSTTGLNTSLADPNGQWTATAAAKIIEKNIVYWEFSFFVDMTNRTNEEHEYPVKMHFMDADGFSVYESYAGDAFNKIPARSTRRLLGRALINPEKAPTVVGMRLEVRVR